VVRTSRVSTEYDRLAPSYESRWKDYVASTVQHTIPHLGLRPGLELLDIGCGTGALLHEVQTIEPSLDVCGVDLSAEMLRVARDRLRRGTPLVRADVGCLPLAAATFDVVVSSSSFHYWEPPERGLAEIARVLRPGGRFVLTDWCDDFLACRIVDRVLRVVNRAHLRIYGSQECTEMVKACGYEISDVTKYKINWLWGLMTLSADRPRT